MNIFRLPNIPLRLIYDYCDNETKRSLFDYFEAEKQIYRLENAGCLRFKETFTCFLCQLDIHFAEMCEHGLNKDVKRRDKLNFHLFYGNRGNQIILEREDENRPIEDQVLERYYRFGSSPNERQIHNISIYYVQQLGNAFSTSNFDEFEAHVWAHFKKKNYWPKNFESEHYLDYSVYHAISRTLWVFEKLQECGGKFPDIRLKYENPFYCGASILPCVGICGFCQFERVPEFKALRGFNIFISNFEPIRSHAGLFLFF